MPKICCSILLTLSLAILAFFPGISYSQANQPEQIITGLGKKEPSVKPLSPLTKFAYQEKTAQVVASGNRNIEEDKQDLMDEALDLINESEKHWLKGDIEIAIDFLDQAYSLVVSANDNSELSRQKDDLRLMISRRILAIYSATKFTVTNGKASQIPLVLNEDVEKEIRSFQTNERNFFIQSFRRSAIYLPFILSELRRAGLPLELGWLPLVESGFKITALSSARALGLWQFIPSTGYQYGLSRNEWVDERMDMEKSTRAAIAYLSELHRMFGDWLTVLAAYNCGEGRLLRVISRQRINYFDRFWDLYHQLPYETARYVPRFLATLYIINDPAKYGFDFSSDESDPKISYAYQKVKVSRSMRLKDIALLTDTTEETLNILNAELRRKVTPNTEYDLKLPPEAVERFNEVRDNIPILKIIPKKIVRHRIKKGETVEQIAKIYRIHSKVIRENNPRAVKRKLVAGQLLRVPINEDDTFTVVGSSGQAESVQKITEESNVTSSKNKDQSGGERKKISRIKQEASQAVATPNYAKTTGKSAQKKELAIAKKPTEDPSGQIKTYVVQRGDNLNIIARKNNTTVNSLIKANKITERNSIFPGQQLKIK